MITQDKPDLEQLGEQYDVIGELSGRDDAKTFIGRRRDTGSDVLITVVGSPPGDAGNALSHLASDVKRLAGNAHRSLVPIIEGRWTGTDALAVVTERVAHPTLEELLLRRDEAFACPRVALMLQQINAVLEWAREEKIVHRFVSPESIYVEPGSDRLLLSFVARPLPLAEMPGAAEDARTIAQLARAMLTRSVADPERAALPLRELRPGLPDRLIDQTEEMLQLSRNSDVPDVSEYIAVVAMSDHLKRAETECAMTTKKLLEEERVAREKIEGERLATEQTAAEQARLFQREREEFAREKEKMLRALEKERETVSRERAALAKERAEHEQDRAMLLSEREEHRRWADEVERAFAAQAAALKAQAESHAQAAQLAAAAAPVDAPPVVIPARPRPKRVRPEWMRAASRIWDRRPAWNRRWNVPLAVAGLLLLLGVTAVALSRGRGDSRDGGTGIAQNEPRPARIVDSVAGGVAAAPEPEAARPATVDGIPIDLVRAVGGGSGGPGVPVGRSGEGGVPADLISGVRSRRDSVVERISAPAMVTPRAEPIARRAPPQRQAAPVVDTAFSSPTPAAPGFFPRPETTARRDTVRRDTLRPRPDSVRPDTTLPDTLSAAKRGRS
jgi:chemotaxis protein histidine kinase CheA